ncbi:ABC transporter [Aspergillus nomiae NRRL 13137]|uniref:ABC transporter n=1 Tax=Aspergillus nomiae NRRL (strain ATCC 15546 / NRRL 13137 / CBS 260.88 / M93) TaxID=1509407 RepID=A0A0L1JJ22_ASPN3|nr:ABC transporter [Aspergillus nomiae NRRL 13137]KNG91707.1 ABC transporter [Aspergillus nomiae NRRL 13137]
MEPDQASPPDTLDLERNDHQFLMNNTVQSFTWDNLTVTVKDRRTKEPRNLIEGCSGTAHHGQLIALMGPSGCGKTTLLNVLARRTASAGAKNTGECYVNGAKLDNGTFNRITSYVEQEDALIGSLTVRETLKFAADLSLPGSVTRSQRAERIQTLLSAFGIQNQASTLVGTPIRKGISGGQKRRVSVASQLITCPKILFLDEPTSGLDSTASYEVISYVKRLAVANNLIIIASIHQPSTTTFQLFDNLLLLSGGKTCYFGPVSEVPSYFNNIGYPIPSNTNPAEYLLDAVSSDFTVHEDQVEKIQTAWAQSAEYAALSKQPQSATNEKNGNIMNIDELSRPGIPRITMSLLHRLFIKSYRDVVAYGIRIVMYLGTGSPSLSQSHKTNMICRTGNHDGDGMASPPYLPGVHPTIHQCNFLRLSFMSFMAVAYVPSFLEDRATFTKERANGLYGALPFVISNFIIGLPYLFIISVLFSIVSYWLSNFRPTGAAFFTWVMWLFLDLVAAESLVVFVTAIFPNFVISLALVAFANGLWMSVGGFLVSPTILNPFWKYVFHYIDYQAYVFQGMMVNEFSERTFSCGSGCQCMYQTDLADQCMIRGTGVLKEYGYATGRTGKWVGILIGIIAVYRLFGYIALVLRRT